MLILQAQGVSRTFDTHEIFNHINFDVQSGDRIGLVGPNGVGKTTLLEILAGIAEPDDGQVTRVKNASVGYLAQDAGLSSDNTIFAEMREIFRELDAMEQRLHALEAEIADPATASNPTRFETVMAQYDQLQHDFEAQNGYGYPAEIRSVLSGFGFPEDTWDKQIATLSGGERSRLALAKLLLERHDLIILDEPTNHLDVTTLGWLENYLRAYKGAVLAVSHDQYFLDHLADTIIELTPGKAIRYTGNYSSYLKQRDANLALAWKAYEKQQEEIKKLQDYVDKNIVRASTTKMAQSRRKQLEKMERLPRPSGREKKVHFNFTADKQSGKNVLSVRDAAVGYEQGSPMSAPINFELERLDRVAIVGPNGVGKSTLLKSVIGQIPFLKGEATFGTNVTVGYYDQDQHQLHWDKTVLDEIWDDHPMMNEQSVRSALAAFLFGAEDLDKLVGDLSGGQKARLELTKLALKHDNLLILDEPTNHLDINSKEVLEQALDDFDGTVLMVSHDRYFINELATRLITIDEGGSTQYLGNWDYYQEKLREKTFAEQQEKAQATVEVPAAPKPYQQSKEQAKARRKLERAIAASEEALNELNEKAEAIQHEMVEPDVLSDYVKMQALQEKLDSLNEKIAQTEDEWEEASLALEDFD